LKVIDLLIKEGVDVSYYDPYIPVLPKTRKYELNLESVDIENLEDNEYDAGIIITNHTDIDYPYLLKKTKIMIDTRNALNQKGLKSDRIWKA
ncbi:MAG: UDP-N-acetyl-D-glucosamine dehydrogenase, partial [Acidobacteriota bacterium]|nr:UDP-N-acetyl-D-glucosamine dehydrogenase [Acidobacteriota bacterium]